MFFRLALAGEGQQVLNYAMGTLRLLEHLSNVFHGAGLELLRFEKLRIAHELRRRPAVAAAFAAGEISYSAVRAITTYTSDAPDDPSDGRTRVHVRPPSLDR